MKIHKLIKDLSLFFPFKRRRIFFVYTHNNSKNRFENGLTANTEISYWSQRGLKKAFPSIHFLRFQGEKKWRVNRITKRDIVIGHIGETYRQASAKTAYLIAFYPWCGHHNRFTTKKTNCGNLELELQDLSHAKSIIFLTSEYNVKKYIQAKRNFWSDFCRNNPVRWVHQPIDLQQFNRIKTSYHTDKFLYIGNDNHMKCLSASRDLVQEVGKNLRIYGIGKKKLNNLDSRAVSKLAEEADFFIQPGMWEAQCVAILEAAARGFIPIVSKETGYPYDHPYLLKYNDKKYNLRVLQALLKTSSQERKELGDYLYTSLKNDSNHNSWEPLTTVLIEEVKKIMDIL